MKKQTVKQKISFILVTVLAGFILFGCNGLVVVGFNIPTKIDFNDGLMDKQWNPLNIKHESGHFTGLFGEDDPATVHDEREGMFFSATTSWFIIRNLTPQEFKNKYSWQNMSDLWNWIDIGSDSNGTRTSVLHTYCYIDNRNSLNKPGNDPTSNLLGTYKCKIMLYSTPLGNGQINHKVHMTVFNNPKWNHDTPQLNVTFKAQSPAMAIQYLKP